MFPRNMDAKEIYVMAKTAAQNGHTEKAVELAEKLATEGYHVGYAYLAKIQPKNKVLWKLCDESLKHIKDTPIEKYNTWLDEYIANKAKYESEHPTGKKNMWVIQRVSDVGFKQIKMPHNFSWMCNRVFGSGLPLFPEQVEIMRDVFGIKHIITIRETKLEMTISDVHFHHFPVPDMFPPTDDQLNEIIRIMQGSEPCMVHCHGGIGRTGTALVAYLLKSTFDTGVPMSVSDAIATVVRRRPWTRLTLPQQMFIRAWNDKLWISS